MLSTKFHADGSLEKLKARLAQRYGIDYYDIYAPVADPAVIRLILGTAARDDLELAITDVPTAFLGSALEERVLMWLPPGPWENYGLGKQKDRNG